MINQATIHKRKQVAHLEKTLMTLRTLEAQHKLNPTPETNGKIAECQTKIKKYMAKDSTKALLWSKQLFYDKANKADTLLARKLKQRTERKQITKINTPEGTLTEKPSEIAGVFQKYFEALYDHSPTTRQNPTHTNTLIDQYLQQTLKPPTPPRTTRHTPSSTSHPHTRKHKRAKTTKHNPQPHKLREPPDKKPQRAEQIPQNRTPRNKYNRTKHTRQLRKQLKQPKSSDHTTQQPYQQPQRKHTDGKPEKRATIEATYDNNLNTHNISDSPTGKPTLADTRIDLPDHPL
ncbi:Hypothetical predicted protein [Pelobates cultripes]|uniref:Uncharacterized protein n=1 Tax=Pelobates cultripes TaxID=61616 RepID=A0AAD1W5R0_PELCU|nr:Hypothetical predicted protein [Pelobates cultripes]